MRTGKPKNRILLPDSKYDSVLVTRFINMVMLDGKKSIAREIVYDAIDAAAQKAETDPETLLDTVFKNVSPTMEVRSRRVGGATYQVPVPVRTERKQMLSMRWLINAARAKSGVDMATRLAQELVDAYNNDGEAIKMKNNVHKMAEANRAFAHFKW